jgi:hypothetical protein
MTIASALSTLYPAITVGRAFVPNHRCSIAHSDTWQKTGRVAAPQEALDGNSRGDIRDAQVQQNMSVALPAADVGIYIVHILSRF